MTRISYAQNFEDVMLARALADIDEGFYVDVGAQDPLIDSVTRIFYERGWKGINIEPVSHWFNRLEADRPRDINLQCAVAASEGMLVLHEFLGSGLSTAKEEYARKHVAAGRDVVERTVPTRRLDDVLAQHAPEVIHFLKVDVEGMEDDVLAGLSLERYRPWILVIEATQPNTTIDVSGAWESSVLSAGYRLVYRDGLNRFYLAEEQVSRLAAFDVPPNVFDDFITYREQAGNEYARSLEGRLQALHDRAEQQRWTLEETARTAETYRTDLLIVTETAHAQQERLKTLQASLAERQTVLEEVAAQAQTYRTDLLVVTETAHAQQERLRALEAHLLERQSLLEETAEKSERRQQRIDELEATLSSSKAEFEQAILLVRRELHMVAVAAENRRVLIEDLESRLRQREEEIRHFRNEVNVIYGSRSWRITAPLRILGHSARHIARRALRAAAAVPMLRRIGRRMLTGRLRQRVLSLAAFGQRDTGHAPLVHPPADAVATHAGQVPLSRAGTRVYRILAAAHEQDGKGQQ